jgi:hypothetical protein
MLLRDRAYDAFHLGKFVLSGERGDLPCVVMSVDFEMVFPHLMERELAGLDALCSFSKDFGFPMTFAVVGNVAESRPDSVKLIRSSNPRNETGSHSYSHKFFDQITREEAEDEVGKSVLALERLGIRPVSFVFPRNAVRYLDLLPEHGFRCFRSFYGEKHRLSAPRQVCGLWDTAQSLFVYPGRSPGALLKMAGLAKDRGLALHIWCHPYNWGLDDDPYKEMVRVLGPLAERCRQGGLEVKTMKELADACDSRF